MGIRQYLINRFGSYEQIPDYLKRALGLRERVVSEREKAARERAHREMEERKRTLALRKPPAKVWRVGNTICWEAPDTFSEARPEGFWISEYRNGQWTAHGDYVLPDKRHSKLFGNNPCRVETKYPQQALGEAYYSPVVEADPADPPYLVSKVGFQATKEADNPIYGPLFRRALYAFGLRTQEVYWGGKPHVRPESPPLTAAEAEEQSDPRFQQIADVLWRLEGGRPEEAPQIEQAGPEAVPPAPPEPTHTYKIRTAGNAGSRGYNKILWWGSIVQGGGTYDTPDGDRVSIIHSRSLRGSMFVFALNGADQHPSDFPTRMVASGDGGTVELVPNDPDKIFRVQGGIRRNYRVESGHLDGVFVLGNQVKIDLYY